MQAGTAVAASYSGSTLTLTIHEGVTTARELIAAINAAGTPFTASASGYYSTDPDTGNLIPTLGGLLTYLKENWLPTLGGEDTDPGMGLSWEFVADDHEGRKRETAAALDDGGAAANLDDALFQSAVAARFFLVSSVTSFGHVLFLASPRMSAAIPGGSTPANRCAHRGALRLRISIRLRAPRRRAP